MVVNTVVTIDFAIRGTRRNDTVYLVERDYEFGFLGVFCSFAFAIRDDWRSVLAVKS